MAFSCPLISKFITITIIIFLIWEFFLALANGFPLESEWQFSLSLSDSS